MMVWLLSAMIFLPLVGAVAVLALARDDEGTRRMALGASVGTLALTVIVVATNLGGGDASCRVNWIHTEASAPGGTDVRIDYHVDLDGISVWLVVLTAVLTPLAIAASFTGIGTRLKEYYALMLVLETGMLGVFCARDLLLFYVFFEFTLVPLFFIIGIWGGPERRRAAGMFFIYTMAGSMLMFAGVLYLAWRASQQPEIGAFTFAFDDLYKLALAGNVSDPLTVREQWWLFLALFAGFAIKVPLFPVHTWLPLAHTEAPTAGSVILAGVLLKLGTYGLLRINLPMLPDATIMLAPFMATLAIVGIVYGALIAWVQEDIKKLVAYSSVSHLGFCVLGMFSLTEAGLRGSLLYMINHGLSTAALFLVVGCIYERYHTRSIHRIGGLAQRMPVMAFFLIFFTLSSIGLPGLNGFVSEFLVLLGTFTSAEQAGTSADSRSARVVVRGVRGPGHHSVRRIHAVDVPARSVRARRRTGRHAGPNHRPFRRSHAARSRHPDAACGSVPGPGSVSQPRAQHDGAGPGPRDPGSRHGDGRSTGSAWRGRDQRRRSKRKR